MTTLLTLILLMMMTNTNTTTCEYYALTTVVTNVDYSIDVVACEDSTGNVWEFYGTEDWLEGDVCSMVMCDEGTDNIEDDTIVSTRYSGYTLH